MSIPTEASWRPTHRQAVLGLFGLGLLVRLAVAPYGGHHFDVPTLQFWAYHLVQDPLRDFYHLRMQALPEPDHLPGDLWILWAIGHVFRLFSPTMDVETPGFVWLIKLVPALADLGVAWLLYQMGAHLWSRNAGLLAAVFVLFNPAAVFLTSVWGQWDSVSLFFALLAFWLFMSGRLGWVLPSLTYATLIKPPFAALFPLLALAYYFEYVRRDPADEEPRRDGYWSDVLTPVIAGAVISMAVACLVCLPFGVGLFGVGEWSLIERVRIAADTYQFSSLYAFNLWAAVDPPTVRLQGDTDPFLLGASAQAWGTVLAAVAYLAVLVRYVRDRQRLTLMWAVMATMFVLFVLPTRVHERYMLPVVLLCALPAAVDAFYRRLLLVMSATYLMNLVFVYTLLEPPRALAGAARSEAFYLALSFINVGALAAMLWRQPQEAARQQRRPDAELAAGGEEPRELATAPPSV